MRAASRFVGLSAGVALLGASVGLAVENLAFGAARIDGGSWSVRDVAVSLEVADAAPVVRLQIAEATLPGLSQPVRNVSVACTALEITPAAFGCRRAAVQFAAPSLSPQTVTADIRYARTSGSLDIDLNGLKLAQGAAAVSLALRKNAWTARVSLKDAPASELIKLVESYGGLKAPVSVGEGALALNATLSGRDAGVHHASLQGRIDGLTTHNASGSLASDKLSLEVRGDLDRAVDGWRFALDLRSNQGQAYVEPLFLDFGQRAVALTAKGMLHSSTQVTLDGFSLDHAGAVQARGSARVDLAQAQPLRSLDVELSSIRFPGAYESYAQPWLLDTSFKALQTGGLIAGRVKIEDGSPSDVELTLEDVSFDDGAGKLALRGLGGRIQWRNAEQTEDADLPSPAASSSAQPSMLRWRSGSLLGLEIGATQLNFHASGRSFRLLAPAHIPLLDGAVDLETFRVRSAGTPKAAFLVDAGLQPISIARLCRAFGWPEFGGQVSGRISKLRMREGVITLGAALQAEVFDGAISISDLRLEEPFGQWPKLHSTIALDRLDLELVTRAFSFGRITGRLSGAIDDLELFNWTPVAFDARFFTTSNDRSRRRISQRAVENLGAIGGGGAGVTAALSSGFLRFFEDFNYDRLGLSCKLRNEVCEMGGLGPAPNGGYYLVKGKGVPRIDVIGNARRVDWPRLVQQLIAITESEGPVVQ